ncbi:MAG: NusG domain II-containing protein [Spirochaetes bacterium]|nr:NusG domain II-containing protein [Spirochaetota bacterium]
MHDVPRSKPTVFDILIVILGIAVVAGSFALAWNHSGEPRAVIEAGGSTWIYPLDEDRVVEARGPLGVTVIHIGNGGLAVESSPCRNQTCVASGRISRPGQWTACLPNGVMARIDGGASDDGALDAIVR